MRGSGFGRIIGRDKLPGNSVTAPTEANQSMAAGSPGRDTTYVHDRTSHPFSGTTEWKRRFIPQWMMRQMRYREAKRNSKRK